MVVYIDTIHQLKLMLVFIFVNDGLIYRIN